MIVTLTAQPRIYEEGDFLPPDSPIVLYYWSFGDGATGVGPVVQHNFADGTYPVTLAVVAMNGGRASVTKDITVGYVPDEGVPD